MQVSLVNGDTGELVEKTEPGRRVTSFYEGTNVSSILPLMTQPFDFRLGEISVFLCQPSYVSIHPNFLSLLGSGVL